MKFNFKIQQYQTDAVKSVIDVFNGQPYFDNTSYRRDIGNNTLIEENGKRFKTRRIVNLVNSCYTDHTPIIYTCFFLLYDR